MLYIYLPRGQASRNPPLLYFHAKIEFVSQVEDRSRVASQPLIPQDKVCKFLWLETPEVSIKQKEIAAQEDLLN